ncbi:MAG: signal peptidase II [Nitrospinae bacterium]|nr:signal peptidase II [Nitrospinota bacterium]
MRNKYLHLLLISNAIVILDQFTKFMVNIHIPQYASMPVVDKFFHLTHIRNSGVAFGLFARQSSEYKAWFFILISAVALIAILSFFHHTPDEKKIVQNGLILIFSGAIGNMIDRILYKEVIDFLDFFYNDYHWPAFNIADSCITAGVGLMMLDLFLKRHEVGPAERSSDLPARD